MKIGKYISELLQSHDSILLPGIGTFTKKYEPARFVPEEKFVKSPSKFAHFSPEPKHGETPLTAYIAEREAMDTEMIKDHYEKMAREMEHALEAGNTVELEFVGSFHKDTDGSLKFEPDQQVNYLASETGITQVKIPSTVTSDDKKTVISGGIANAKNTDRQHKTKTKKQEAMSEPAKKDKKEKPVLSPALKWVAIILIPLLILLIILFLNYNFFFGENGFFRQPKQPVAIEEPAILPAPDIIEEPVIEEPGDEIVDIAEEVPAFDPFAEPPRPATDRPVYIIVVGSFRNETNASELALQLRKDGQQLASVLDQTHAGFFRTYSGFYYNLNEAKVHKSELPDELRENAWILHR